MKRIMAVCVAVLVRGLFAETVALYDFSGGVAGESVGNISDLSGSGYAGTGSAAPEGALVYSDDVPGKVLMPSQMLTGTPLSTDLKSLEFVTGGDGSKGGYVNIPNLGGKLVDLGTTGDFTVECYVKVAVHRNWTDVFKFFCRSDSGGDITQPKFVDYDAASTLTFGFQAGSNSPQASRYLETNVWYHVAVVYTSPTQDGSSGAFRSYVNGTLFDTLAVTILGPATNGNGNFRLGGTSTTSECLSGKIAAVRVTDAALAPNQFLRASSFDADAKERLGGVLGLWTMEEGTAGQPIVETPNAIDAADVLVGAGVPYVRSYVRQRDGIAPVYSDDVPGDRILSGSTNRIVIAKNIKSAKFSGSDTRYFDAGSLTMTDFRSRVAQAGAFTLEYFVKYDAAYTWRDAFATYLASSISLKMCNNGGVGNFGYQYFSPTSADYFANVSPSLTEGWHHVALEWDAQTKKMVVYVDYAKCAYETSDVLCENTPSDAWFGCARDRGPDEALNGKIACIRLTPRRLDPVDMMVVANGGDYDDKTLFHWSFEDTGAADGATVVEASAGPVNASGYRGMPKNSNSKNATYAAEIHKPTAAYVRQGKELLSTNRFSAYFYGYSKTYGNTWAGSQLYMNSTSDMNVRPESFTVEMFIRRDLDANEGLAFGTNGELLMSFGGQNINTSLENTDISFVTVDNSVGAKSLYLYYYDKSGTRSGLSIPRNLEDGVWHHLAVTYDETTRVLGVYLDYKSIASTTVEGSLRRTMDQNWSWTFGRGANSSGFVGWMDDIRVSTIARQPEEFLRHGNAPAGLMLLFR